MAKLSTIRQNISHLRKMLKRVKSIKLSVPTQDTSFKIRRRGSQLLINGKVFKPADLEKLIKSGKTVEWQAEAIGYLEEALEKEEYRRIRRTGKRDSVTALSERMVEQAKEGIEMISSKEEIEFMEWLNKNSPGWKKNLYYHVYGADTINKGDVRGFLIYNNADNMQQLEEILGE